ncbi:uncharacterized protein Z518_07237 [Rhinocladiella mackenziei CBS 650.93]|uniref:Rhinocladiella mackenziei CBS 650.93 unplaced genomic scaffold supercont1.5, whole genome shotgun sequence n=1 Tax=Rhinocladiella mackenziei CBS 650.93 TaxID=1442369 RepID=A0A0D2ICV1_9EURO|nr:uncharacterized protein Z518_07237 [Rhinocladiella mackenziei CBS 650.93]KIX03684.1 hypothetical protein Z518_07237 [Rhinocladiella mackenziei CBS 650.93]
MPLSTQKSVAQADEDDNSEAEAVTAILNEEASIAVRTSPRNRKRSSNISATGDGSPRKRVTTRQSSASAPVTSVSTESPRRQSGRLQARTSLPTLKPVNKRNPYDFPDEPEENIRSTVVIEPPPKLRNLNKQKQLVESPFKGKGVLETKTTARVNLDDSPKKQPKRKNFLKIGKSIKNSRRPIGQRRSARLSGRNLPFDGEDILDAALREENEPEPLLLDPKPSPAKSSKRSAPAQTRLNTALPSQDRIPEAQTDVVQEIQHQGDDTAEVTRIPDAHTDKAREEQHESEEGPDVESGPAGDSQPPVRRPDTEADRKGKEQAEAEEKEKRRQMIEDSLRGIEEAVELHECKESWQEALVAAAELNEGRSSNEPASPAGEAAHCRLKSLIKSYKMLSGSDISSPQTRIKSIQEDLAELKGRCKDICGHSYRPDQQRDQERSKMIGDIYEHLIPGSLTLAKMALKARYRDNELSTAAHWEISQLLKITRMLCVAAAKWRPRPQLGNTAKSTTKQAIAPNVEIILRRYLEAAVADDGKKYVDDLEVRQRADLEKLKAANEQRRAEIRTRRHQYLDASAETVSGAHPWRGRQSQVVDIDDLHIDEIPAANGPRRERVSHIQSPTSQARSQLKRTPAEYIPPCPHKWDVSEMVALLNALQKHRGQTRFQDIVSVHGRPGGRLEKYDVDEIMAQARWIKQSMARQLQSELDGSWDWLRSVPG